VIYLDKVYVFLAEGFEEIEAVVPIDILRRAGAKVQTAGVSGKRVRGSHNIEITADITLDDVTDDAAMIILPGGMPGTDNLQKSQKTVEIVKKYYNAEKYIAAICAAPKILGELELLNGKKATCYPGFEKYLTGATVTQNSVEVDKNIITGKGAGAAYDFAFALVELLFGKEKASGLRQAMYYNE